MESSPPATIRPAASTYAYLATADLTDTFTHPSGLVQDRNWETRGLLSSITTRDKVSSVLESFTYGLNFLGQRNTTTREDSAVLTLGYDARRQVISGQNTTAVSTAQPAAITYATNPLNQYSAIIHASPSLNPTVDLNGSTLNDGRNASTWDERNQRRSVTQTATLRSKNSAPPAANCAKPLPLRWLELLRRVRRHAGHSRPRPQEDLHLGASISARRTRRKRRRWAVSHRR